MLCKASFDVARPAQVVLSFLAGSRREVDEIDRPERVFWWVRTTGHDYVTIGWRCKSLSEQHSGSTQHYGGVTEVGREFDVVMMAEREGGYSVFVPELPSVATQGETIEEARANAQEAIEGYLEVVYEGVLLIPSVHRVRVAIHVPVTRVPVVTGGYPVGLWRPVHI